MFKKVIGDSTSTFEKNIEVNNKKERSHTFIQQTQDLEIGNKQEESKQFMVEDSDEPKITGGKNKKDTDDFKIGMG